MKQKFIWLTALLSIAGLCLNVGCSQGDPNAKYPFPQHNKYAIAPMLPTDKTQDQMDDMIIQLFKDILLNEMIADANGPKTKDEFRLVIRHSQAWEVEEGEIDVSHINVSESQGYGMMMMAYMAGAEDRLNLKPEQWIYGSENLQDYYNAMLRTVQEFPSVYGKDNHLFCWELTGYPKDGENQTGYKEVDGVKVAPFTQPKDGDSATDGDMDIIYSLLLADQQWGSDGDYNYKQIALDMLDSLWTYCVHKEYHTLLLGDWASKNPGTKVGDATRSSDFILDHLKVYVAVDKDHDWQSVVDATYEVIKDIRSSEEQKGHNNGFLPDFVVRAGDKWEVPKGDVLEGEDDSAYAYNSCRIPWRLGTDYLTFGNTDIGDKSLLDYCMKPLDTFAKDYTKGDLNKLGPFYLDGSPYEWDDADVFAAPFLVTAAATGNDQDWVDQVWAWDGLTNYTGDTYGDYIKLLAMITASGNYWLPTK